VSRRRQHHLVLLAAFALASASGCASMQQRVAHTENRSATLEAQVADLQATQQDIITRLVQLREDLERQLDPVRAQQASGGADVRTMQSAIDNLQEQVRILTEQLAAFEAAAAQPPDTSPVRSPATPPTDERTTQAADPAPPTVESEQDILFNSAYGDYTAGEYVLAVSAFEEFVSRYPDSARAPDALYWMGESLAGQDLHREARERFLEVATSYPDAPKVRDALLRAALEAVELGERQAAVRELRELIAAHPQSDAALVGCMQLDRLGESLPAGCRAP
jgi:tol-pal system protein YbgF